MEKKINETIIKILILHNLDLNQRNSKNILRFSSGLLYFTER